MVRQYPPRKNRDILSNDEADFCNDRLFIDDGFMNIPDGIDLVEEWFCLLRLQNGWPK